LGERETLDQVHFSRRAERRIGAARLGVNRQQVCVMSAEQDAFISTVRPVRDAAMHESQVGGPPGFPGFRIVLPDGFAGGRFNRG
jgi:hypothetical protein